MAAKQVKGGAIRSTGDSFTKHGSDMSRNARKDYKVSGWRGTKKTGSGETAWKEKKESF